MKTEKYTVLYSVELEVFAWVNCYGVNSEHTFELACDAIEDAEANLK